jgi:hypothetical protein
MIDAINRFASHPLPVDRQHIRALLGASEEEIDQVLASPERVPAFRSLYQRKLQHHATFVRFFEMRDDRNRVIYYLFFATNHRLGHVKIKEVFWRVDTQSGFKFSDHTDPNQLVLFELDPSQNLATHLGQEFAGRNMLSQQVMLHVEDKTAYTTSHAKKALKLLENTQQITVEPNKSDGEKRIKGTFATGTLIHF